ncbi:MAG: MFS transporter, partial [Chloroflexota bacterium]
MAASHSTPDGAIAATPPAQRPGEGTAADADGPPAPVPAPSPEEARARNRFLVAIGASAAGSAMLYLSATTIIATNGDPDTAAQRTALYLSLAFLAGLWVPWVPSVGRRVGIAPAYAGSLVLCAVATFVAGLAALLGEDPVTAMLVFAVAVGVPGTVKAVYHPLLVKAYFRTTPFPVSITWQGIAGAAGWTAGSMVGGLLADRIGPVVGLLGASVLLLSLPLVVVLHRPDLPGTHPGPREGALRSMRATLARAPRFRRIVLLSAATALFLTPMSAMAVPLALELRPPDEWRATGASLLMSAFALGRFLAPPLVRRLSRDGDLVAGTALAGLASGIVLLVFAAISTAGGNTRELLAWALLGLGYGGLSYGAKSLTTAATDDDADPEEKARMQAVLVLLGAVAASAGAWLWGWTMDTYGAIAAIAVGGVGVLVLSLLLGGAGLRARLLRRRP